MAAMFVTSMHTVPTLLALIIVHVRKDILEMDARVQRRVSGQAYSFKIVNYFLYSCCPAKSVSRFHAQLKTQS